MPSSNHPMNHPYNSYLSSREDNNNNDMVSPLLSDDVKTSELNSHETLDTFTSSSSSGAGNNGNSNPLRRRGNGNNNSNKKATSESIDGATARSTTTNTTTTKRILDRHGRFHQSRGRWSVNSTHPHRSRRCWDDWFHSLAYTPTLYLMLIVFVLYSLTIVSFAFIYLLVSKLGSKHMIELDDGTFKRSTYCGMQIRNVMEAMYFSLSTQTTLGYAISDYYFGDCWTPFLLVLIQIFSGIIFDAVAVGLLFQRMSRGQKRGRTIIFSDKAVVRRVGGVPYFMFRVGELRKTHIIEARVRVFCVRHERYTVQRGLLPQYYYRQQGQQQQEASLLDTPRQRGDGSQQHPNPNNYVYIETSHYVTHPVKLHPDETLATNILMSLPHLVVHKMDDSSPLIPPSPHWYDVDGNSHSWEGSSVGGVGSVKAATTAAIGTTATTATHQSTKNELEGFIVEAKKKSTPGLAPNTTPTVAAPSNDNNHDYDGHNMELPTLKKQQKNEDLAPPTLPPPPYEATNLNTTPNNNNNCTEQEPDELATRLAQYANEHNQISKFLSDRDSELIVLVEGTDEMTGSSVQARHSYRMDDILFDHAFVNCVSPTRVIVREEENEGEEEGGGDDDDGDVEEGSGSASQHSSRRRRTRPGGIRKFSCKECLACCKRKRRHNNNSDDDEDEDGSTTAMSLDFKKFHDVVPAPLDCDFCPFVNNS